MLEGKNIGVVIAAAGSGTRMGLKQAKQFLELDGKPVLVHSLAAFQRSPVVDHIVVSARREDIETVRSWVTARSLSKVLHIVEGGQQRQDSVWNGIQIMKNHPTDILLVHDAVRPFIDLQLISSVTAAACSFGAAVPGVQLKDTIKSASEEGFVRNTLDRRGIWLIQTPQAFQFHLLWKAYEAAMTNGFYGTDDAALAERCGQKVKIVEGNSMNIKITTPEDFALAEQIARVFFKER